MSVIILLIIFSVIVATAFLIAFIWAVRSGQFDDTKSPSVRMLFDEEEVKQKESENPQQHGLANKKKR